MDEEGNLVKTFDYEEFGLAHPSPNVGQTYDSGNQNAADNQMLFAGGVGHPTDESGLIYMRARYYDPASGRFISEDPGRHGTNWYAYCGNNPANLIDGNGQFAIPAIIAALIIGAVIGLGLYIGFQIATGGEITAKGAFEALGLGAVGAVLAFAIAIFGGAEIAAMTGGELLFGGELGFMGGIGGGVGFGVLDDMLFGVAVNEFSTALAMDIVDYGED